MDKVTIRLQFPNDFSIGTPIIKSQERVLKDSKQRKFRRAKDR